MCSQSSALVMAGIECALPLRADGVSLPPARFVVGFDNIFSGLDA